MADTINVKAFLWVIRHCEGTSGQDGYRTLFGGSLFDSFEDHPRVRKTFKLRKGGTLTSSAAGAYQILEKTWDNLVKQNGFKDFTPETQDKAAIALIRGRRALQDVEEGRFEVALKKCALEWASLPGSPYGQPTKTLEFCKQIYKQYGGIMVAPLVAAVVASAAKPFLTAAFEALAKELPTLGRILGSGTPVSNQVIESVVDVVKEAVGAKNDQEAVDLVKADPELAKAADDAIKTNAMDIFNLDMSNVGEARLANESASKAEKPFWKTMPAFWVTISILPIAYYTVYQVLTGPIEFFSPDIKASLASAVVSLVLGGVIGFWLGASYTTSKSRGLNATPSQ